MALMSNDYIVQGVLGEGSFSRVFKIQHKITGIQYAGKHLKKVFKGKQDIINCTEINVMKRIEDHPNILNLIDLICNAFPCKIVLVFELMDMNLYEFFRNKQKPLSESIARTFFHQIVCGVQHLHKNGVFHRDVKPENILLKFPRNSTGIAQGKNQPLIKLADFGSAKSIDNDFPLTGYVATRWYRPPECLLTEGYYGPKMDVWAAGCIFYEMLTLTPLFPGESDVDQLNIIHKILGSPSHSVLKRFRHLKNDFTFPKLNPVRLSTLVPNLSKLGLNVLKTCLSYLPDTRIDSTRLQEHYYFIDERHRIPNSARRYSTGEKNKKMMSSSSSKLMTKSSANSMTFHDVKPFVSAISFKLTQKRREENESNSSDKSGTTRSKKQCKLT